MFRSALVLALALMFSAVAGDAVAQAPRISKPKPVPPGTPVTMPPLPPAQMDSTLNIGGDNKKARKIETRMRVDVMVHGRGPYRFVVDSGADSSVVGLRLARDLQLPLGTPAILNGMTDRSLVDRVKVNELVLGPSTIRNLQVPALREEDLGGQGMIGIDALVRQRLMMDFEKRVVKVEDARTPMQHYFGEIVVTARRQRGQLILTQVRAVGLPLDAVIDTGSEITIGNTKLRDKLIRGNRDKFLTTDMIGVTGKTVKINLAVISELQLGPVTLRDVPIAFADVPPFKVFGLDDEPALLLGTDILETFRRVSLDFRARKVRFQLRKCDSQNVILSTSSTFWMTRISSSGTTDVCGR
jgi:hypothetical protein